MSRLVDDHVGDAQLAADVRDLLGRVVIAAAGRHERRVDRARAVVRDERLLVEVDVEPAVVRAGAGGRRGERRHAQVGARDPVAVGDAHARAVGGHLAHGDARAGAGLAGDGAVGVAELGGRGRLVVAMDPGDGERSGVEGDAAEVRRRHVRDRRRVDQRAVGGDPVALAVDRGRAGGAHGGRAAERAAVPVRGGVGARRVRDDVGAVDRAVDAELGLVVVVERRSGGGGGGRRVVRRDEG